jgi:succinate CoA transferase
MTLTRITPEEAASQIHDGQTVAFSGFTPAGAPKVISRSIATRAEAEHSAGRNYQIGVLTGASTGPSLDGVLAKADAISWRTPYQSDAEIRKAINSGRTRFFDMHLSMVAQATRYGFLGKVDHAVIEACDISDNGEIVLTTGVGIAPTVARMADKVYIELNRRHPAALRGFHDIYEPLDPPHRLPIPLLKPTDRIGSTVVKVDPKRIVGVVETDVDDETGKFRECDPVTLRIGANVAAFLAGEMKAGRIPKDFLPLQSGVGETANAVLVALGENPEIPVFQMYTEVIQDAVVALMKSGNISFASGSSLTVSPEAREEIYKELEFFRSRLVLRPQEISNHPELIRRMGIISCNTALEADIFGNVNSTHLFGQKMMNGIGGSGDFTRNAYISMFICASTQKNNNISTIVPQVSHTDHNEHSVMVIATEWGVADLRGKAPAERARLIIDRCAHPDFREMLRDYVGRSGFKHTPTALKDAFHMHQAFEQTGSMNSSVRPPRG